MITFDIGHNWTTKVKIWLRTSRFDTWSQNFMDYVKIWRTMSKFDINCGFKNASTQSHKIDAISSSHLQKACIPVRHGYPQREQPMHWRWLEVPCLDIIASSSHPANILLASSGRHNFWTLWYHRSFGIKLIQSRHFCIHECCISHSRGQSSDCWIWGIHIQRPEYDYCPILNMSELNSLSIFKVIFNFWRFLKVPVLH